jgi:hypothetical protein
MAAGKTASGWIMVARNAGARKRRSAKYGVRSGRMQVRGGDVLGAPGGTGAAHVMLFRPVGMERRDDELTPELADFADQPGLASLALHRLGRGRRCDGCHGAFCRLPGDFRTRKSPKIVARAVLAGLIKKLFLLSGPAERPLLGLLNC